MLSEQAKTLNALDIAIRMEIDGRDFYQKAARESSNELGRGLLATLAAEEDIHREVFTQIYEAMREKRRWPIVDFRPDGGQRLRTVFTEAVQKPKTGTPPQANELDAIETARLMESRTYDFYKAQQKQASEPAEAEFYESLAAQEQMHNLTLADYQEYLRNPAGWFVKMEHPHLD
jgi:rubrerythrin